MTQLGLESIFQNRMVALRVVVAQFTVRSIGWGLEVAVQSLKHMLPQENVGLFLLAFFKLRYPLIKMLCSV